MQPDCESPATRGCAPSASHARHSVPRSCAFDDRVLNNDLQVRECFPKGVKERLESGRAAQFVALGVHQPVGNAVLREKALDGLGASLIPDLLEPFVRDRPAIVGHGESSLLRTEFTSRYREAANP